MCMAPCAGVPAVPCARPPPARGGLTLLTSAKWSRWQPMRKEVGAMTKSSICLDRMGTKVCCHCSGCRKAMKHSATSVSRAQLDEKNTRRRSVRRQVRIWGQRHRGPPETPAAAWTRAAPPAPPAHPLPEAAPPREGPVQTAGAVAHAGRRQKTKASGHRHPGAGAAAYLQHLLGPEAQQGQVKVQVDEGAFGVRSRGEHDLQRFHVEDLQRPFPPSLRELPPRRPKGSEAHHSGPESARLRRHIFPAPPLGWALSATCGSSSAGTEPELQPCQCQIPNPLSPQGTPENTAEDSRCHLLCHRAANSLEGTELPVTVLHGPGP